MQSLFKIEKEKVKSVDMKSDKENLSFSREDDKKPFVLAGLKEKETLESNPLSGLLNDLSDFSAEDITLLTAKEKELTSASQVSVKLFDDKTVDFEILYTVKDSEPGENKEVEKDYFIKILPQTKQFDNAVTELGKKWLFSVADWKIKKWIKPREDYLKKN